MCAGSAGLDLDTMRYDAVEAGRRVQPRLDRLCSDVFWDMFEPG